MNDAVRLAARLLTSVIFVTSGIAKIFAWDANIAYVSSRSMPLPAVALLLATCIELAGSVSLILGYRAKVSAWVMFGYMVIVDTVFHRFGSTDFQKNLGIMGALLMLAACGAGGWALDARRGKTAARPMP